MGQKNIGGIAIDPTVVDASLGAILINLILINMI